MVYTKTILIRVEGGYIMNTGYPSIDKRHNDGKNFFERNPIIPDMSVVNAIALISVFYRDAIAIDCLDLKVTYQELLDTAKVLTKAFKELGIKNGDIITASMPNFFQAIAIYFAANKIGAITTFLNPGCSIDEIKYYLNEFESPLFIDFNKGKEYNESVKKDTRVRQIITLKPEHLNVKTFNQVKDGSIGYSDYISFNDLKLVADYYKGFINPLYGGNQESLILFTSGSTGIPKSVVLTNENILASGIYMKNSVGVKTKTGEKCLVCVPFSYPYGFATSTLMTLLCGREAILAPTLSKENINYYLKKNPNIIFGSPAMLELIKRNAEAELDLSSVHTFISGGDFLPFNQLQEGKQFFKEHGSDKFEIYNGSGNAESGGASTNAVGLEVRPETVGKVLTGTDAIIVNPETLEELKYGEEGMLCISGKHIFKEYYRNPELTKSVKFEYKGKEYFKTGTIGILDEQGYFTLTGRASRFYIRSDLNKVYCEHVQQIINNIECVDSCVVVKKTDDDLVFTGKAYIVLKPEFYPTQETIDYISEKCKERIKNIVTGEEIQLKDFEIPSSFEFIEKIPRNVGNKIDYNLLEERARIEYESEKKMKHGLKKTLHN